MCMYMHVYAHTCVSTYVYIFNHLSFSFHPSICYASVPPYPNRRWLR